LDLEEGFKQYWEKLWKDLKSLQKNRRKALRNLLKDVHPEAPISVTLAKMGYTGPISSSVLVAGVDAPEAEEITEDGDE
ncbi:hypothetical protein, partial [Staphylococcus nepalensis]|uniref:hypothetical protein n=1 Tax=Staphylococcus nepalensis TaxID=214473 RepID=UPI00286566D3